MVRRAPDLCAGLIHAVSFRRPNIQRRGYRGKRRECTIGKPSGLCPADSRQSSFVGAIAVGDLVKSTLGPKGMVRKNHLENTADGPG